MTDKTKDLKITVTLEMTWHPVLEEIYPDGVPEGVTVEDVREVVMEAAGRGISSWLREWNLEDDCRVDVYGSGAL